MTYIVKIKCMACGLHYQVFSWSENWHVKHGEQSFCPECGIKGRKLVCQPEETEQQIFELVPGTSSPYALSL